MKIKLTAVILLVAVVAVAGFLAGAIIALQFSESPVLQAIKEAAAMDIDRTGFVPADVDIVRTTVSLAHSCYEISFDVTDDQAFSIQRALLNEPAQRPLTHDILTDVLNGFNITVNQVRIERFGDDIYYARAFVQRGDRLLDLDLRPSDAIALSLRTRATLYINQSMLQEKGDYIC